jgi:hypothetical protein
LRLRVVHLPVQGELDNLVRPYILVFDRIADTELAENFSTTVGRFPELSGGACHGVIGMAEELDIE